MESLEKLTINRILKAENVQGIESLFENLEQDTHPFLCKVCRIGEGGHIILDFGKEICGKVHILFGWNEQCGEIRVRLGESVAETCADMGEKNAGNHHSLRDSSYPVISCGTISTSESGFRFARIDAPKDAVVNISAVYVTENINGLSVKGHFSCSDSKLNEIYQVAEHTICMCVRDDNVWDGIKRDRVFWMGDFYPELLGAYMIYGKIPQFKKALDTVKEFNGSWINNIPSYSAWWMVCLEKYYELTADREYVISMIPYIEKIIRDFTVIVGEDGNISYDKSELSYYVGNEFFIDWPTYSKPDSETGWKYLLIFALKSIKKLLCEYNLSCDTANMLLKRLDNQTYPASEFKQVTALGVLAGKIEDDEARALLKKDGASGMSSFMSFAIAEALGKIGEGEFAVKIIKEYYGAMLKLGATTFWEDFDLAWLQEHPLPIDEIPCEGRKSIHADYGRFCYTGLRHSLCHGWSSGFIDFLYKHILGIEAVEPGYKAITVKPNLCGLEYAEGEIASPFGMIYVKHQLVDGNVQSVVRIPDGIQIIPS